MAIAGRRNLARSLRRRATDAERELWRLIRAHLPLERTYFRRQVAIGPFIVDFACFRHRLVIELDGSQHGHPGQQGRDENRTRHLAAYGFRMLRFWNHQVFTEPDAVLETILAAVAVRFAMPEDLTISQPLAGPTKDAPFP